MRHKNIFRIVTLAIILLLFLLLTTRLTDEVSWTEALAYWIILLAMGGVYGLWRWLKTREAPYRLAFGIGLAGIFLLGWVSGAVGIIGSENNPANLMYWAVFAFALIGSFMARFKPRGMAYTLFTMTIIQILIPLFALFVWPAQASWGEAGVYAVFVFNSIFAMFFLVSALLFRRAGNL